jgi:ankyrin repeat protein
MTLEGTGSGNVLFYAAQSGNLDTVREILRYHPDVNARDRKGQTPIFAAGESRSNDVDGARVEIVRLLVSAGADVNARDQDGNTPLHETWLTDVGEELLNLGADVNARNHEGETPIFTTVDHDAISLFLEHGADLTIRNKQGQTIFDVARDKGPTFQEALRKALEK